MFLLRSAFWLTIGFLVVAPHGTDFGATASAIKDQAMAAAADAGQELIKRQMMPTKYASTALLDVAVPGAESLAFPSHDLPRDFAVFPRPRPAALG